MLCGGTRRHLYAIGVGCCWEQNRSDVLSYLIGLIEKDDDVCVERLLQTVLLLDDVLYQGKKAALRVVPCVRAKLLAHRIQRFDD